jgi:flavin-dependent dehydrogenase
VEREFEVAIVGAGPAGSTLARLLAGTGPRAVLIDGRGEGEKPCGGGVTARGWRGREILADPARARTVGEAVLEAGEARVEAALPVPVRIFRRRDLDRLLRDAATAAGAPVIEGRVRGIESSGGRFLIRIDGCPDIEASFIVGADGAGGICRRTFTAGGRGRAAVARGFHAPLPPGASPLWIRFPRGLAGYVWSFPRADHASAGICCRDPAVSPADLDGILERTLEEGGRRAEPIAGSRFAFPIPDFGSFEGPRRGPGWALVGDAGAFVDPITLEGIPHAIRSAEILAGELAAGRPEGFEAAWRADFGRDLAAAARFAGPFYAEGFPERMVRCAASHPRVRRIVGGMMAGTAGYRWLRMRTALAAAADRAAALAGIGKEG